MASEEDVRKLCASIAVLWPAAKLALSTPSAWYPMLKEIPTDRLEAALREWVAEGHDWAPGISNIVALVTRRELDVPEWDQAWDEVQALIRRKGGYWGEGGTRGAPPAEAFSHAAIAAFAIPAWEELCRAPAAGTNGYGTHHAQQREAYRAVARRAEMDAGRGLLGVPRRSQLEGGSLRRLSAADMTRRLLPGGDET